MSDDIVTRLRAWQKPIVTHDDILDLRQAADEIERLRAERDQWRHVAELAIDRVRHEKSCALQHPTDEAPYCDCISAFALQAFYETEYDAETRSLYE